MRFGTRIVCTWCFFTCWMAEMFEYLNALSLFTHSRKMTRRSVATHGHSTLSIHLKYAFNTFSSYRCPKGRNVFFLFLVGKKTGSKPWSFPWDWDPVPCQRRGTLCLDPQHPPSAPHLTAQTESKPYELHTWAFLLLKQTWAFSVVLLTKLRWLLVGGLTPLRERDQLHERNRTNAFGLMHLLIKYGSPTRQRRYGRARVSSHIDHGLT
jgi:hypothetical protein